jgi:hypothetical protein
MRSISQLLESIDLLHPQNLWDSFSDSFSSLLIGREGTAQPKIAALPVPAAFEVINETLKNEKRFRLPFFLHCYKHNTI